MHAFTCSTVKTFLVKEILPTLSILIYLKKCIKTTNKMKYGLCKTHYKFIAIRILK